MSFRGGAWEGCSLRLPQQSSPLSGVTLWVHKQTAWEPSSPLLPGGPSLRKHIGLTGQLQLNGSNSSNLPPVGVTSYSDGWQMGQIRWSGGWNTSGLPWGVFQPAGHSFDGLGCTLREGPPRPSCPDLSLPLIFLGCRCGQELSAPSFLRRFFHNLLYHHNRVRPLTLALG